MTELEEKQTDCEYCHKEKIQKIQDDIFLTEKAKEIAINAYKKEFFLNFKEMEE